jgi:hypothetical protein
MSRKTKKSIGSTFILIILGLIALFAGPSWLSVLIPAAILVWYSAGEHEYRGNRSL